MAKMVQGGPPEGQWWSVVARDLKGRLVFAASKERSEQAARALAEAWARKVEVAEVAVTQW